MNWYPLFNAIRVALIAAVLVFFAGIFAARRTGRLSGLPRSALDAVFSLPLVLPPTVSGWLLLRLLGPRHWIGIWLENLFHLRLILTWQAAILPAFLAAFPIMYRVSRRTFDNFDGDLSDAALTLGRSEAWAFWMVEMPSCRRALLAGFLLSFARAAGEFGATAMTAGYTPGRTATASTAVYYLWRGGDQSGALAWVLVNLLISSGFLLAVSLLENGWSGFHFGSGNDGENDYDDYHDYDYGNRRDETPERDEKYERDGRYERYERDARYEKDEKYARDARYERDEKYERDARDIRRDGDGGYERGARDNGEREYRNQDDPRGSRDYDNNNDNKYNNYSNYYYERFDSRDPAYDRDSRRAEEDEYYSSW